MFTLGDAVKHGRTHLNEWEDGGIAIKVRVILVGVIRLPFLFGDRPMGLEGHEEEGSWQKPPHSREWPALLASNRAGPRENMSTVVHTGDVIAVGLR